MEGIVKSYNPVKHYGFIISEGYPTDIFFHETSVMLQTGERITVGQCVKFTIASDKLNRTIAHDVVPIGVVRAVRDGMPYVEVPGRGRRYMRVDPEAAFDPDRHRRAAEALFAPVRPEDGFGDRGFLRGDSLALNLIEAGLSPAPIFLYCV